MKLVSVDGTLSIASCSGRSAIKMLTVFFEQKCTHVIAYKTAATKLSCRLKDVAAKATMAAAVNPMLLSSPVPDEDFTIGSRVKLTLTHLLTK